MDRSIIYKYIIHSDLHKPMSHNESYVKFTSEKQVVNRCNGNELQKSKNAVFRAMSADDRSEDGANGNTIQNRKGTGAPRLPGEKKHIPLPSPKSPCGTTLSLMGGVVFPAKFRGDMLFGYSDTLYGASRVRGSFPGNSGILSKWLDDLIASNRGVGYIRAKNFCGVRI